ncbi:MAG: DHH family phosphoesterase [Bacilli bacterium]|nr:DHH family phosphoesterase [Bacilli bacterium]
MNSLNMDGKLPPRDLKELKTPIEELILGTDRTIIVPHNNLDYDAIGSAIGLSLIPKKLKKPSYVLVNDFTYKIEYGLQRILEEAKETVPIINKDKYLSMESARDLIILTDVSNSRLISLGDEIKNKDDVVVIDHHDPTPYLVDGKVNYVDTSASSASEIVTRLLKLYKIKIPANVANYLLAGIYLDTGKFSKISGNTSKVMADLFDAGASMDVVKKWFVESFESYRKVQEVVNNVKFYTYRLAIAVGDLDMEYKRDELAKSADALLKFGVDASFAIGTIDDGSISISARGNDYVDVASIMRELDGGGNPHSAAANIKNGTLEDAEKSLIKIIRPKYYIK